MIAQTGEHSCGVGESSSNIRLVTYREIAQINILKPMDARFLTVRDASYKYRRGETRLNPVVLMKIRNMVMKSWL